VRRDEPVLDLHYLDDVQLIAVRAVPGVLPGEAASVGEQGAAEPAALRGWCGKTWFPAKSSMAARPRTMPSSVPSR
jgi:hypothetical protein